MKAVLISIQPRHCGNIESGKKKIEVRKKRPTCKVPFKAFIYCTKDKWEHFVQMPDKTYRIYNGREYGAYDKSLKFEGESNGKVIGEFVCDKIEEIEPDYADWLPKHRYDVAPNTLNKMCLSENELWDYGDGKMLYGWHISDLKIYDKPKELREFERPCINVGEYEGEAYCDCNGCELAGDSDFGAVACDRHIIRPPQSWCYVEEIDK